MKEFIERISKTHSISKNSMNELQKILNIKTYPSKYKLVKSGEIPNKAYYLISGAAKSYNTSKKGKERISGLYTDGSYIAELTSLILKEPSIASLETLTTCRVVEGNYYDFIKLTDTHADLNILHRKNLEHFYTILQKQDFDLANLDATERYLKLIKEEPKMETLVTQKNIAAHLGVSQVQLSRIKKELYRS
jgi:CRP-like cAMP-binding protein